jgi:hypothetical protein
MSLHESIGLKVVGPAGYEIFFKTKLLGTAIRDVDGFYYFRPQSEGYWSEYALRIVADAIQWLNRNLEEALETFEKEGILKKDDLEK